jgi:hypothetical protein
MERELKVPWEAQAKLVEFASTFDEYAEMVVQFCLVVAFAAAFPLAPLLALMNNVDRDAHRRDQDRLHEQQAALQGRRGHWRLVPHSGDHRLHRRRHEHRS